MYERDFADLALKTRAKQAKMKLMTESNHGPGNILCYVMQPTKMIRALGLVLAILDRVEWIK